MERKDGTKFKRWDLAKIDFIIGAYKLYYIWARTPGHNAQRGTYTQHAECGERGAGGGWYSANMDS